MITKEQLIDSIVKELLIIKHLAGKLTQGDLSYRPTEKQRSMQELLEYLAYIFSSSVSVIISGDRGGYEAGKKEVGIVTLENFTSLMEKQIEKVRESILGITDDELNTSIDVYGVDTRALHLFNKTLKWSVAYKMQLFLYMKSAGHTELVTANLWRGSDPEVTVKA